MAKCLTPAPSTVPTVRSVRVNEGRTVAKIQGRWRRIDTWA